MYDLMYMGSAKDVEKAQKLLKELLPDVVFEDASDMIHEHRFSLKWEPEDKDEDDYYQVLLVTGLFDCSFHCQTGGLKDFQRVSRGRELVKGEGKTLELTEKGQEETDKVFAILDRLALEESKE